MLHPTLPSTLKPFLPNAVEAEETYRKSQSYGKDKLSYASFIGRIDLLETVLLLSSVTAPVFAFLGLGSVVQSAFPWFGGEKGQWTLLKGFWDLAGGVPGASTELKQSLAFVALMTTLGTALSLPKEYYKNFVLEEKHGFNKTTKGESSSPLLCPFNRPANLTPRSFRRHLRRRPDQGIRPLPCARDPHHRWYPQDH